MPIAIGKKQRANQIKYGVWIKNQRSNSKAIIKWLIVEDFSKQKQRQLNSY